MDCPACGAEVLGGRCRHDASLVADVSIDQVLVEALDVLASELAS